MDLVEDYMEAFSNFAKKMMSQMTDNLPKLVLEAADLAKKASELDSNALDHLNAFEKARASAILAKNVTLVPKIADYLKDLKEDIEETLHDIKKAIEHVNKE